jgi:hypothetical protein
MRFTLMAISILLALASLSCRDKKQQQQVPKQQQTGPGGAAVRVHDVVVQEVVQATSYTYLRVKEADKDFWIAINKRRIEPGATISFKGGLEMKNFQSKDLQRTFETIYFVNRITGGESSTTQQTMSMPHQGKPELDKKDVSIEPAEGCITIGQLFANRDSYADKTVLVRGQVTKVNRAIMDKNWVHLQDGTSDSDNFDLTVTTTEDVEVGSIVTFEGKIALKKDFGAGYYYELIMEQAKLRSQ